MNGSQNNGERRLFRQLQQLVSMLGLDSGQLTMEVHQGSIRVVDINRHLRLSIDPNPSHELKLHEEGSFVTSAAERFLRAQLEPVVLSQVGPYGRLNGEFRAGIVTKVDLVRKVRNTKN